MKSTCILLLALWSPIAAAQSGGNNNELLMTLYDQLQALQQEVQSLRGLVEEQAYQLQRLQAEQRDRYIDIDRRLTEMSPGAVVGQAVLPPAGSVPGDTAQTVVPQATASVPALALPAVSTPVTPGIGGAAAGNPAPLAPETPPMDEQELYRTALSLLLDQGQYEESVRLFQSYISSYPQGRLLTNALYWQGEALILVSRLPEARDVFMRLLSEFPQDPKAAGAMLKLGVVYQQMGNVDLATQTWREIESRYPESVSEINLARDYLNNRR